jgi:Interferon-induced transmembrane protein/zinc-ribbon domain
MFCPQCGANNADNAAVCAQCGRSLQPAPTFAPGQVMPPGSAPPVYVPNYLVFAILATVFCCLPAGIPAIVYAAQVNGKLQAGDIAGAQIASKNAKMWCWIALGAGLAIMFIYALLMAIGVISHMHR